MLLLRLKWIPEDDFSVGFTIRLLFPLYFFDDAQCASLDDVDKVARFPFPEKVGTSYLGHVFVMFNQLLELFLWHCPERVDFTHECQLLIE